jgi:uncharacterized protein YdeI (YjbR/CyaY-like superfamily)
MAGVNVQRFKAVLEKGERALGWTIARVPFDPAKVWKKRVRLRVKGAIKSADLPKGSWFAFRTSLFSITAGGYFLLVNQRMQKGGEVRAGEMAEFALEPDMEPRKAEMPDELAVLLDEEPGLREWYDEFTEYTRRTICAIVAEAKTEETRLRRAEQMAERLLATMEGEKELPPVIAAAFRRRPKAKAGWAKMTPTQRRHELLAVFYYQTPEAREKRVGKLCDLAEKKA